MDDKVLINRTDMDGDYTIVYFKVPSLNIDSKMKVLNVDFIKQLSIGGYAQLGLFLLNQLNKGIESLINEVVNQDKTDATEVETKTAQPQSAENVDNPNIIKE
ncbi:hypothetical protein [Ligilactobacillus acidipiscis]|uniref:hypothetical protein n=1 Tax=Ligilactobacillus acidipiscis TaxID=89059 RepID=UPI0022E0D6CE|nr:hypothetical protein [Ligilactobacillus acidipiscis]